MLKVTDRTRKVADRPRKVADKAIKGKDTPTQNQSSHASSTYPRATFRLFPTRQIEFLGI